MRYTDDEKSARTNRRGRQIRRAKQNNRTFVTHDPVRSPNGRKAVQDLRIVHAQSRGNVSTLRARVAERLGSLDLQDVHAYGLTA